MAPQSMSRLASIYSFCVLGLMVMPHQVYGSSRGSSALTSGISDHPPADGICATLVTIHGYKCQEHEVVTEDGYILSVQRIPGGRVGVGGNGDTKRQPVLIQHGVLVDGVTWLLNQPEQNLPTILADQGFDVWISNTRGTRFSNRHLSLQVNQKGYWNWSWDELAKFDLPAVFDYVYNETGQKIHYVGHSQGTLIAMAALSEGLLVEKIKSAALLSPVAYLNTVTSILGVVCREAIVCKVADLFGDSAFDPKEQLLPFFNIARTLCDAPGIDCYGLLAPLTGPNCCLNVSTFHPFIRNEPQPTSMMNIRHCGQSIREKVVAKYDYGSSEANTARYGEAKAPAYNLSNIPKNLPLFLSYGALDTLSDVRDVNLLLGILKPHHDVDKLTIQYINNYAHMDFIMGVNAKDIVYTQVLSFFKNHTGF
ncbi:triacylglycerol lipase 2 [Populus alba]|uniref:triacylglycerol lipase 2 n=1 Tax=Populus alba TaxID=43335 RepID=UPI001588D8DD|nr:triacylglycerol lipase 2-like [Populus alba]